MGDRYFEDDGTFPRITADFFTNGMHIPESTSQASSTKSIQQPDWKHAVNRAFMRGFTAKDILNSIGDSIEKMGNSKEVLNYIKKYEGLMGTVFVDASVIHGGFPYNSIPKKFEPYHRFAINCKDFRREVKRTVEGGNGGGIDDFLNSVDVLVEEARDICNLTGLPVLKKGMFNSEVISELLQSMGLEGNTMAQLQDALKKNVLYPKTKPQPVQSEKAENYHLKNQAQQVQIQEVEKPPMPVSSIKLKHGKTKVDIKKAAKEVEVDFYKKSGKEDVRVAEERKTMNGDFNLKRGKNEVNIMDAPGGCVNVEMDYKPKNEADLLIEDAKEDMGNLEFDDKMRF